MTACLQKKTPQTSSNPKFAPNRVSERRNSPEQKNHRAHTPPHHQEAGNDSRMLCVSVQQRPGTSNPAKKILVTDHNREEGLGNPDHTQHFTSIQSQDSACRPYFTMPFSEQSRVVKQKYFIGPGKDFHSSEGKEAHQPDHFLTTMKVQQNKIRRKVQLKKKYQQVHLSDQDIAK